MTGQINQYDRPIAYAEDGSPELWDHDTHEGRQRIQKRQAQAEEARHAAGTRSTTIADGLWWTDRKTGERKWSGGTQVFDKIDRDIRERFRKQQESQQEMLEAMATRLGEKFAEERAKLHDEIDTVRRELELRMDAELLALKQRSVRLDEEEAVLRQAQDKARVVGFKR